MNSVRKAVYFAVSLLLSAWPMLPQESTCGKRLLPVFVTEKDGSVVTTLTSVDFRLASRSGTTSMVGLKHDERRHRVIILLDVSASMRGAPGDSLWQVAMALARHASSAAGENSDLALVLFFDRVLETVGFSQGKGAVQQRLEEVAKDPAFPMPRNATTPLAPSKDSRIYDMVREQALKLENPTSADSFLVITDGLDEGSTAKPDQIIDLLSNSMIRVFTILVDPTQGQPSSIGPDAFVRIVQRSGGNVFGPIGSNNAAFRKSAKMAEAQKVLEEQLSQFYRGIYSNDVLVIQTPSVILKSEVVGVTLTDSVRQETKKAQIHFPHEIGPCPDTRSSRP